MTQLQALESNAFLIKEYQDPPKLPRIFKRDATGQLVVKNTNPGHQASVLRGYSNRVYNFLRNQSHGLVT